MVLLTTDARECWREYDLADPYFSNPVEALLQGFQTIPEIEIHIISCTQRPMATPVQIAPNITYHGLLVPKIGWMRTMYQGCVRAVREKLKEIRPDMVHAQGTERDCAMCGALSGLPAVLTIHGNMRRLAQVLKSPPLSFLWLSARLERFVLPRFEGVVCITRHTQSQVANLAKKTWLIPNAVSKSFFALEPSPDPVPKILCPASIAAHKNQIALIEALDALAQQVKFKLLFAGDSQPGDPYADRFQESLRTRPWCEHLGFVDQEPLKQLLVRSAAVVLPSVEDNCPMAIIEAKAAGIPVAAARIGGIPDLITHGQTGLLFDPFRPDEMRDAVKRLLCDAILAQSLASAGRMESKQRFYPDVIARQHVEVYREVLSRRS
ncbi:MAG: glycosyltransferase family 4 protein [Verrucomicrobiota bacterium]